MTMAKPKTNTKGGKLYVTGKVSNTHYDPRWFEQYDSEEKLEVLKIAAGTIQPNSFDGYLKVLGMTPDSPLKDVLEKFYDHTPIALELPYYSFLLHLAAWLAEKEISLDIGGQNVRPYLWIIILAKSGGYKSFATSMISETAPVKYNLEGFESDAKFINMLHDNQENNSKNFTMIDEFGQVLKKIESDGSPLSGCKKYFLTSYDANHTPKVISRKTNGFVIEVKDPAMNFLGINVYETFLDILSAESCKDGFFQRFSCVIASDTKQEETPRDPRAGKYTRINKQPIMNSLNEAWSEITNQELHETYKLTDEVNKIFENVSDKFSEKYPTVPDSFFIRERFKLYTYALLFHVLRGKGSEKFIDKTDAKYSALLFEKSLENITQILRDKNPDKVFDKIEKVRELRVKHNIKQAEKNESERKNFQIRDIVAGFAGKVKSDEAVNLWKLAFPDLPEIKRARK